MVPKTCKYLQLGRKIPLHNSGAPIRNWLHASDTANAILKIIEANVRNEIYNIAGHFEQSNWDTVKKIIELYHNKTWITKDFTMSEFVEHTVRPGQYVRYAIDDSKLQALGWYPKAKFNKELPKIVNYYKEKFVW